MTNIPSEERRGQTFIQPASERFDVIVIGGGQAGLAAGYHLACKGLNFVILDAYDQVGDAWRNRCDSSRPLASTACLA